MTAQRLFFALILLCGFWLVVVVIGAVFAARFASMGALRTILALSDNWLLRPLYCFVGWIVEAGRLPDRDG